MKTILGLIVLLGTYTAEAKSTQLLLRAVVPPVYQVKMHENKLPVISSNQKGQVLPKMHVNKTSSHYMVSIVHP